MMVKTNVFYDGRTTKMVYHSTIVAQFNYDTNEVTLNTGGWMTNTTKKRMNQFADMLGLDYHVFQEAFDWYVIVGDETLTFRSDRITFKV